ncbi:LysR family transcriptional regulator [Pseudomonas kairouanensis]|uniref:LysR family transcriptional regulator n=2 Tax=Pseudomonas kairouanensis TaxID=2293832 RepID=A0A4Z0AL97_9PSED|nr:LysR family transcriptional regulator [Pseudomonas kairouanensis]
MQTFVRVTELGSFTSAAESLGYSVTHVSRSVSELEAHLKAKLLNRTTRRLALTEVGARYLQHCKSILESLALAELEASGAQTQVFGKLRMHAPNGVGQFHIIALVAQYLKLHPDVDFELTLSQVSPDLLGEGYDLMITADSKIESSGFFAQTLGTTYSVFCMGLEYLKTAGAPATLAELAGHDYLALHDPSFPKGPEIEGVDLDGMMPMRQRLTVNVADSVAQAARQNMGICLVPGYVAADAIRRRELVRVLTNITANRRDISVIYPSRQFQDAKIRTWIEFLKANLPKRLEEDDRFLTGRQ